MPNTPPPTPLPSFSNPDPNSDPNSDPNPNPNPNPDQEDPQILSSDQEQDDPEPEMSGGPLSPPKGNPVISTTLRRGKRKKGSCKNYKSQLALTKKLNILSQNLNLIPFIPAKVLDLNRFEVYLKKLDLWEFCNIEFDTSLRGDLIAQLLASYNVKSRGSYVNEYKIGVNRASIGKALRLPGKKGGDSEEYPDEFVSFLVEFVSSWMLLHGDEVWATPNEVVNWLGLIREKHLEKVDWAGLVWYMVEKEVSQGSGLKNCYYASHLQQLIKEQREHLLMGKGDEVIMVDAEDGGDVKMVDVEEMELVEGRKLEEVELVEGQKLEKEVELAEGRKLEKEGELVEGRKLEEEWNDEGKVVEGFGPVGDEGEGDEVEKEVEDDGKVENVDGEHEGGSVGEGDQKMESVESGQCVDNIEVVDGNVRTGENAGERAENAGERAENAGERAENAGEHAENACEHAENAGERAENAGERSENAGESAETADLWSENTDTCAESVDVHTENGDEHTENGDEHTENVDEQLENCGEHTENVDEHTENVDEHNENDHDHVKNSDEHDEDARGVSMDIDMMDLGYDKASQGSWLLSGKNDGGRFFLQRCSMDGMNASFEDRHHDDDEDDGDDDGDDDGEDMDEEDNEEDEHVEGFKIMQKGPLDGMTSANLVQDFETGHLQFAPHELGQSSLELMSSRPENNVIMGDSSIFNHFGKRPIDLEHDISHHGLNDDHKKLKFDSSVVPKASDFNTCMEQMQFWFEKAKMSVEATRDEIIQQASMNEQILSHQIAEKDNEILQLKYKLDELLRKKQTEIHHRDRELYLMNSVIEGYRRALKQTQKEFTEFRKRHAVPDEPIYKDAGSGGVVKSIMELERERIKQEEEQKMMCRTIERAFYMSLDDYMLQWEELDSKVLSLEYRLKNASEEWELLKDHLVKRKSSASAPNES